MRKLSIIIPAYNEERTLEEAVRRVEGADLGVAKEIVIVDDGSTDSTRRLIEGFGDRCRAVFLPRNMGKGSALRAGFAVASGDYVVVQDADLEYDPSDLRIMVAKAREGHKVVYGSRRMGRGKNPMAGLSYYAGGVLLSWLSNLLYGTRITDEPTCYKMFDRELLNSIPLRCERFEFCPEVTAKVAKRGERIVEVPISYAPRSRAEGKKIAWRDGVAAIRTLLEYRFRRD